MSEYEPREEDDLTENSYESDSEEYNHDICADIPDMIYDDDGRPLGTRRQLVDSWFTRLFKDPDGEDTFERGARIFLGKDDSDTHSRQRKGIIAHRTIPIRQTTDVTAYFTASRDALIVVTCLCACLNITHRNYNPYTIQYYENRKKKVIGVVYDLDHFSMQDIEERRANPNEPLRDLNFRDIMKKDGVKKEKGKKKKKGS